MPKSTKMPDTVVVSSRVILYLPANPLHVILRQGLRGMFGLLGGKNRFGEDPIVRGRTEVWQEARMRISGSLQPKTTLYARRRAGRYSTVKLQALRYSIECWADPDSEGLLAWNPVTIVFSGMAKGALPKGKIEGREVRMFDLNKRSHLSLIRPAHRTILLAWRRHITKDQPMPAIIFSQAT